MKVNTILYGIIFCLLTFSIADENKLGIDVSGFDTATRPQDNFYQYVNGAWLENTRIPDDKSNYGAFTVLNDEAQENLKKIIEDAAAQTNAPKGSDTQKVGDMYRSFMDTTTIEALGMSPIQPDLRKIAALQNRDQLAAYFADARKISIQTPFIFYVNQDLKNATEYIGYFYQSGLGMPDRSYYLEEKFADKRAAYKEYITTLMTLAEQPNAAIASDRIMAIEMDIAAHHWTRVENRDRNKTYNKYETARLGEVMPNFNWAVYLEQAGLSANPAFIVNQPSYFAALDSVLQAYSLDDWKMYLTFKLVDGAAPFLSSAFVDANFDFRRTKLSGIEKNEPRWKRGVQAVEGVLGEVVGRLYVEKHFKPEAKARMNTLVGNLRKAFEIRIGNLEWMSETTKAQALEKLNKFTFKIGYPDKWKNYDGLEIDKATLAENMKRSSVFEYHRMTGKLGNPIDRSEWFMTPQTVNAYYNPPMNEIVFPAAILQPPFFNMAADDAVNYGAIGAVIGHEFSHGFDDQGRKSDGDGNLRDWWTTADAENFQQRSQVMIDQYNQYNPIDSMFVNGQLTLGENIADIAGLTVAYEAYKLSLNGKKAPEIGGFTGEQRFFMGWAQVWRRKYRDEELRRRILTDPHSPSEYRVNGIVSNMPAFYEAFQVKPGDPMYRDAERRVNIW